MTGFKNHRFQAGIVAGFGDPFHLASVIYIDCIEIPVCSPFAGV